MSIGDFAKGTKGGSHEIIGVDTNGAGALSLDGLPILDDLASAGPTAAFLAQEVFGSDFGQADTALYDGHVAFALDPSLLTAVDNMLDQLTSSHDLFDVPVMDIAPSDDVTST